MSAGGRVLEPDTTLGVHFAALGRRPVAASGERATDVGVRLSYADLDHYTEPDPLAALDRLPAGEVDVIANYTAFYLLAAGWWWRWGYLAGAHL